jgi:hypothetical protein
MYSGPEDIGSGRKITLKWILQEVVYESVD